MNGEVSLSLKLVIFCIHEGRLKFFLPGRVLPYGNLEKGQSLDTTAKLIFSEWLSFELSSVYLEQLYTFSYPGKPSVIVTYYILLSPSLASRVKDTDWKQTKEVNKSIPDREVIFYAIQRLRWKVEYTNVVYSLLPDSFTLSELQQAYEAILGKKLDKRNFRKKILTLGLLKSSRRKKLVGAARPAKMYEFKNLKLTYVEILKSK